MDTIKTEEFWNMFQVNTTPTTIKNGDSETSYFNIQTEWLYNISNRQTVEDGKVIKDAPFERYITEVIFLLTDRLKPSEIVHFLNYHYNNAVSKDKLFSFIKYDIWELIPNITQHRKDIIMQWISDKETAKPPTKENLSHDQIALLHIYSKLIINRGNMNRIANAYGWKSANSGLGVYQSYKRLQYLKEAKKVRPDNPQKVSRDLKEVLNMIPEDLRYTAINDLKEWEKLL